jgi:protein gp37
MSVCRRHQFLPLTKQPADILAYLNDLDVVDRISADQYELISEHVDPLARRSDDMRATCFELEEEWPLPNVSIGCSVMNQSEADKMLPAMRALSAMGWRTHVWYEPAIGPVDWKGWEFIELLIPGGESGSDARAFDLAWARNAIAWGKANSIAVWMKQLGAVPVQSRDAGSAFCPDYEFRFKDRKGADMSEWPADLRVRQMPEVTHAL